MLDHGFLMCAMVDPSISSSAQVACTAANKKFNTDYPNEVLSTPFFLQEASQTLRGKQDIYIKFQVKNHIGSQRILQPCCAHPNTPKY